MSWNGNGDDDDDDNDIVTGGTKWIAETGFPQTCLENFQWFFSDISRAMGTLSDLTSKTGARDSSSIKNYQADTSYSLDDEQVWMAYSYEHHKGKSGLFNFIRIYDKYRSMNTIQHHIWDLS